MSIVYTVKQQSGQARLAEITFNRKNGLTLPTPLFMPIATYGAVRSLLPEHISEISYNLILSNTYHLWRRPGMQTIASHGGLGKMMNWPYAILTDSGGYQIYSLSKNLKITDHGATFTDLKNGDKCTLTPEIAMQMQAAIGSDIAMILDHCPPADVPKSTLLECINRTTAWAVRAKTTQANQQHEYALFGIAQGGCDINLRQESIKQLTDIGFSGYALGGFSVGENKNQMRDTLERITHLLPIDAPRYLMGVGTPLDILHAVTCGIDMFDCVLPTRNARHGTLFCSHGILKIRNQVHRESLDAIDDKCSCNLCTNYSRSYLRHLYTHAEPLAISLMSLHNLSFYAKLMQEIRQSIATGTLNELHERYKHIYYTM